MKARLATKQDAGEISTLIISAAANAKADFDDGSWELFLQMNNQERTLQRITDPSILTNCIEQDAQIAGMICVRGLQKIELMFVLSRFTKRGIAAALWQQVKKVCEGQGSHLFWVRSSSNAIPVYQSFGFEAKGAPCTNYGITYQLMELETQRVTRSAQCCCGECVVAVNDQPVLSGVCHCDDCKKRTGSAFGFSAYFPNSKVIDIKGDYKKYAVDANTGEQERYFCQHCGTTLYWTSVSIQNCIGIAGGCFIENPLPEPEFVSLAEQQCGWLSISNTIKRGLTATDIPKVDA